MLSEGLDSVLYYEWKKQLLGSASRIFEDKTAKPDWQEQRAKAEVLRLKNVIAEITAENLDLKKGSRIRGSWPVTGRAPEAST